ncbi:MAG: IPTL-CTERM sorting domain-containing protein [Gammaproteobacteria bacterium]|nr:IPTL-CTERM sorting domain-containing protein [Gammaproteobacteria bacterium]
MAAASLALLPMMAFGQTEPGGVCNAELNAGAVGGPLFYINEPITIGLSLGAGEVLDGNDNVGWLDIFRFSYQMDCSDGDTWPECNAAGNTVEFMPGSVTTSCTGEGDVPVTLSTEVVDQEVIFTVTDPESIRNLSENVCEVTFDIMVTDVADENTEREIIELTGFGSILGEGTNDAVCSNTLTAGGGASVRFDLSTLATRFLVTKEFSDDNPDPVQMNISCNDGFVSQPSFSITQETSVTFVVKDYLPGFMNCVVWESDVDGYTPTYEPGLDGGIADLSSDGACRYDSIVQGDFTCNVVNDANPASFTVRKVWDLSGAVGDEVDQTANITITCTPGAILTVDGVAGDYGNSITRTLDGNGEILVTADTGELGTVSCSASETLVDSGVEPTDDCVARSIANGESSECTFTNTVFFEGIPTLNQYGLALLALLMLGVGMVSFRRFA